MNTDRFTKFIVPDATVVGFSQSKRQHEFVGACQDRQAAERSGRMQARPMWCVCPVCLLGRFNDCIMQAEMGGRMRHVTAPLAAGVQERQPQMQSLEAWGDSLEDGLLCAMRVVKDDLWMEGPYWLVRLLGPAFPAPSHLIHSGCEFEEGWLIVKCQYYKLEQVSERGYRLLPGIKYLVVNAMVRLSGLEFVRSQGGPQQRKLRTTATGPAAEARKQGEGGLSFLSEDMHNTIQAACEALSAEHNARCEPDNYSPTGELLNPAPGIEYDIDDMEE